MWAVVSISLDTGNPSVFATKLLKMLLTSNGVLGKRRLGGQLPCLKLHVNSLTEN